jgi:two-component system sensor histidine kinase DegS
MWRDCHEGLKRGVLNSETKTLTQNSLTLKSMIANIDTSFYKIYNHTVQMKRRFDSGNYTIDDSIKGSMQIVLNNESLFLKKQDEIVFQYDAEAKARVEKLKKMEFSLLAFTIIVLILEGLFVFRPAAKNIRKTIEMLVKEESKTKQINEELNQVNASLKKAERELLDAEKQKYQHKVSEQRVRSASLIQGQEEERNRISKELHDGLGQLLTTLKLTFENLSVESFSSEKEKKTFREGRELIQETIDEVRNISFNLMPSVLSDFGIASALKLLCNQTARNTVKTIIFKDVNWVSTRLDKNVEIGLYRIAQEALNNAIKYSESDEIIIEISLVERMIELTIIDHGKGFQRNILQDKPILDNIRNGISNMEERAKMIGGSVKIISNDNQGTKVYAKVPLKY